MGATTRYSPLLLPSTNICFLHPFSESDFCCSSTRIRCTILAIHAPFPQTPWIYYVTHLHFGEEVPIIYFTTPFYIACIDTSILTQYPHNTCWYIQNFEPPSPQSLPTKFYQYSFFFKPIQQFLPVLCLSSAVVYYSTYVIEVCSVVNRG